MGDAVFSLALFGFLGVAVYLGHQRKILQMRLMSGGGGGDQGLLNELRELKRQLSELRDTTTRYDMSFDSALQRLEGRIARLEQPAGIEAPDAAFHRLAGGSKP